MNNSLHLWSNSFRLHFRNVLIILLIVMIAACQRDHRLDKVVIHENPLIKVKGDPEILLDSLSNASAAVFVGDKMVFCEGGKGIVYEYRDKKAVPLIEGFGVEKYGDYAISILGITATSDHQSWLVTAAQDSGHVFMFDATTFPTTIQNAREIAIQRTEAINPFGILITNKGILVATGGTKSVYHGNFDRVNPNPLLPAFDVSSGVEGIFEDAETGHIFGAVVGTGKDDGSIIEWDPNAQEIQPRTITTGFTNLVGVLKIQGGLLLTLEFGAFDKPETGRLSVVDLKNPKEIHPLITGLDAPSCFSLNKDKELVVSTFGKPGTKSNGMLLRLTLAEGAAMK